MAPFWRGLNEHSESWTEYQLVAVARGRPLPAPDEIPEEETSDMAKQGAASTSTDQAPMNLDSLSVPITSRSQSFTSETSSTQTSPTSPQFPSFTSGSPAAPSSIGSALSRGRSKTLASLTETTKASQAEIKAREVKLPHDPNVNGQPIEAYLYKDASECPICFLYYPKYLNKTRCCDQAICTECFVQIKRPDPHPPEHHSEPGLPPIPHEAMNAPGSEDELVSEPAQCPYCNQPEFGVTYEAPPFRRGLLHANYLSTQTLNSGLPAMSSSSSIASGHSNNERFSTLNIPHRRTTSISATDPLVITTDRVRPDWHQKLAAARAHTARRSAAATALHTAAYLMGNRGHEMDSRSFGAFGRRGILRRGSGADVTLGGSNSAQLGMLALMSERYASQAGSQVSRNPPAEGESSVDASPHTNSRRRRVEDLEDMMMMEAIRLSLASEEDRKRREEKDAKKEAKKKDKETRKAEKVARKSGSSIGLPLESSAGLNDAQSEPLQNPSVLKPEKGKSTEQAFRGDATVGSSSSISSPQIHLERARQQIQPADPSTPSNFGLQRPPIPPESSNEISNVFTSMEPDTVSAQSKYGPDSSLVSPLQENASSTSLAAPTQEKYLSDQSSDQAGAESVLNFSSLAAMVGKDRRLEAQASGDYHSGHDHTEHEAHFAASKKAEEIDAASTAEDSIAETSKAAEANQQIKTPLSAQ